MHPVTHDDLHRVRVGCIGEFYGVIEDLHRRLCEFIHGVVVFRRNEALRSWKDWLREDSLVRVSRWSRPDLVHPAPFLQCHPSLTPCGSVFSLMRRGFCRSAQGSQLGGFDLEIDRWLPLLPEVHLPALTGAVLADVVRRKNAIAGGLEGTEGSFSALV